MKLLLWAFVIANAGFALMYLNLIAQGKEGYDIYFLCNFVAIGLMINGIRAQKRIDNGDLD